MSYKNFLVHVDDRPRCKTRLEMAAGLAESFGASLTGLGIRYLPRIPQYVSAQIGPALEETQKKMLAEATEREKAVFDEVVEHFNIGHEFRVTQGDLIESFCQHARYTDVVVVGQRDDSEDFGDGEGGIVDHLILDVGRPVLVVPYSGTFQGIGKRVLVAWNGSREATRAVNDALPFLERAEKVEVVVINPTIGRYGHGDVPG
ncbi:MAG: universal stress protein, partial [Rhodospirillaceae bacterium]